MLFVLTIPPCGAVTSALPGNYNDSDLSPDEVVPPRPAEEATDISLDVSIAAFFLAAYAKHVNTARQVPHRARAAEVQGDDVRCMRVSLVLYH